MEKIKLAIIGAGSSYTPELVEGLVKEKEILPVDEIAFLDVDEKRLEIMIEASYLNSLHEDKAADDVCIRC